MVPYRKSKKVGPFRFTASKSGISTSVGYGPVRAELAGLTEARPGLAQAALAIARLLDNPRAVNQQPAAAKVLVSLLDRLRSASAHGHRGRLAVVRTMTEKGGA
jgi:Protein of unknown function (DUF4236)